MEGPARARKKIASGSFGIASGDEELLTGSAAVGTVAWQQQPQQDSSWRTEFTAPREHAADANEAWECTIGSAQIPAATVNDN